MIVGEHLQRQARERPDKVAVICNEVGLTFSELNLQANPLANRLLELGLKKGDRAVMLLPLASPGSATRNSPMRNPAICSVVTACRFALASARLARTIP